MAPNLEKKRAVRQVMLVRQASSRATPHGRSVGIPIAQVFPPSAHPHLPPQLLCTVPRVETEGIRARLDGQARRQSDRRGGTQ